MAGFEEAPSVSQERMNGMADDLEDMNNLLNNGRGAVCVEDVILYLRRGDIASARNCADTDQDKIRRFCEIQKYIFDHLFNSDDRRRRTFDTKRNPCGGSIYK
ncbi:hypothetical protein COT97_05120 [Candidatus Falkowbacteria bacterium CG10_big_fil_rev_8_21_14_0_10_39_11]|uniref:Uncharacterized protein n=1 Tax=Candidatus Falkowbacteria bacterium CG10_big_fil_rev_8_21_14_0_10_39_11 TaxID=1974565 RepID=A0A2H0V3U9_9BACT|nr:MAG: hypothetical protein COT97_05120 [Candidatus Falkowbacteria bacterium CG10_big_fil_rev_8_21_14_0_10_39_11]